MTLTTVRGMTTTCGVDGCVAPLDDDDDDDDMHAHDAIEARRSVKKYDANHEMTAEEVETLVRLAMMSPTAFNIQHWRIVHVADRALRQKIRDVAWDQAQVTDASTLFVLCADVKAWEKQPERYWRLAPEPVRDFMIPAIDAYYRDKESVQRDETMRSMGIAGQTIMIAAKAMGYDTCPMDGFDYDAVGALINLPSDHCVGFMIAVGKALEPARERAGQLPTSEILITDRFD